MLIPVPSRTDTLTRRSAAAPVFYVLAHKGVIRHAWIGYPGKKTVDTAFLTFCSQWHEGFSRCGQFARLGNGRVTCTEETS